MKRSVLFVVMLFGPIEYEVEVEAGVDPQVQEQPTQPYVIGLLFELQRFGVVEVQLELF